MFQFGDIGNSSHTQWLDAWSPTMSTGHCQGLDHLQLVTIRAFWLQDADYLRLKNVNLGYDIPDNVASKVGAERINLFANGTNLFMIYSKIDQFDPETIGRGIPVNKTYSLGINVTF